MSLYKNTYQSARRLGRLWRFCAAALCVAVLTSPTQGWAGSIDYLTNQSADFMRTLGRNSATDAADVAYHNPAGAAFLEKDGLYLNLSNQFLIKNYEIEYKGTTYGADDPTLLLPSLYALYKWKSLAAFFNFTIPAGGGDLEYEDGVPYLEALAAVAKNGGTPTNGNFKGSSMYLGFTLGAAYEFLDIFSIAAAARLTYAKKTYEGSADYTSSQGTLRASLDAEKKALGVGGIFGIHVRPVKYLDIGIRYETETALDFETTSTLEGLKPTADLKGKAIESFIDGATEERNLPAMLGMGISGHIPGILKKLSINFNFNYYFINQADKDADVQGPLGYVIGYDDDYDNGMEVSGSLELHINDAWVVSAAYGHAWLGGNAKTYSDFEYALDADTGAIGARWAVIPRLKITLAFAATFYEEGQNESLFALFKWPEETFDKQVFTFALGLEYRFLGPDK